MSKQYRSEAMAALHESVEALHKIGAIGKRTTRHFDHACFTAIRPLNPSKVRAIRKRTRRTNRYH